MSCDYQINAHQNGADNIKITEHDNPFNNLMSDEPGNGEVEDGEIDDDEPIPNSLNMSQSGTQYDSNEEANQSPTEKEKSRENKTRKRGKHRKKHNKKGNADINTSNDKTRNHHNSPHKKSNKHGRSLSRSKLDTYPENMDLDDEEMMGVYGRHPPPKFGSQSDGSRSKSRSPSYPSENEHYSPSKRERLTDVLSEEEYDIHVALHEKEGSFRQSNHPKEMAARKRTKEKRRMQKSKEYFRRRRREHEQPPKKNQFRERSLCKYYKEGRCGKAENCEFSHDFQPPKKQELCKFYATSHCLKGDHCIYLHDEFPCKFYHTGSRYCRRGDDCKFSHSSLTKESNALLERFVEERPFALDGDEENNDEFLDYQSEDKRKSLLGSPPSGKGGNRRDYASEEGPPSNPNFRENHDSSNFDGSPPNRSHNYYDQPNFGSIIRGNNPHVMNPQMPLNQRLPPNMINVQGPNSHLPPANMNNPNMFIPPGMNGPPMPYNRPPPMMRGPPRPGMIQGQQPPNFMNRPPHFQMRINPNIPLHPNMRMRGHMPPTMRGTMMPMPPQEYMNNVNMNDQLDKMAKFIVTGKELNAEGQEEADLSMEGITNDESEEGLSPSFLKRTNAEPLIVKMGPITVPSAKKAMPVEEVPTGAYVPDKSVELPDARLETPPVTETKPIFSPNSSSSLFNSSSLQQPAQTPQSPDSKPPSINANSGPPREIIWRLLPIEVPIKVPYPLMKLPTDLPHLHNDPRLKGQVGVLLPKDPRPRTSSSESTGQDKATLSESPPKMPTALLEKPPPFQLESEIMPTLNHSVSVSSVNSEPSSSVNTEMLGIAFGASTNASVSQSSHHKPFQLQLNEMSSLQNSNQLSGNKSGRSYLADPRFRRRKANNNSESGANTSFGNLEDPASDLLEAEK